MWVNIFNIIHEVVMVSFFLILFPYSFAYISFHVFRKVGTFPRRLNYKKQSVPTGYGLFFGLFLLMVNVLIDFVILTVPRSDPIDVELEQAMKFFRFLPPLVAFVGYYDDVRGQRHIKGLTNNVKTFLSEGCLTSSLVKAITVFVCAALCSSLYQFRLNGKAISGQLLIIDTLMISLFANLFNLLDLRPGRAIKAFLFLVFIPIIFTVNIWAYDISEFLVVPVFFGVLAYAPLDFRGQAMMGDAGSNMLGFVLGIGYAVILPLPAKIAVVLLLTLFHIYCEFYSFSDFISRNRVLRYLDELGTCMRENKK